MALGQLEAAEHSLAMFQLNSTRYTLNTPLAEDASKLRTREQTHRWSLFRRDVAGTIYGPSGSFVTLALSSATARQNMVSLRLHGGCSTEVMPL